MPRVRTSPSQSQTARAGRTERGRSNQIQPTIEQAFNRSQQVVIENIDELVKKCVKYVLYRAGSKLPLRQADIRKHVLQNVGRNFDEIMTKVIVTLKEVYGYDVYLCVEPGAPKQYLVSTALPYKAGLGSAEQPLQDLSIDEANDSVPLPPNRHKILIMIVLTHIFMSNNNVSEASLFSFLQSVYIDPEETHEVFGNVKDFIKATMVKQKYLSTETDKKSQKVSYSWGPRSEHEVSKHAILKFISNKIYQDRKPKSWITQYASANQQFREVEEEDQENMEGVEIIMEE